MSDHTELVIPTGADAVAVRDQARAGRAAAERRLMDLEKAEKSARAELDAARRALELEFAAKRAELEAQIQPLREQLKRITEVAWTVDLYLGRDEEIQLLCDGERAPLGTPLTIRQRVLVMAEESLILMDGRGQGVDFSTIGPWVQWLTSDRANIDQLLPEPKGIVVLVPTRVPSRTGNPWEDEARDRLNSESYWLIRNGERVHLLTVSPDLTVGSRILPKRTEFTEVFEERLFGRENRVQPGSEKWLKLEEKADARRRHYMRLMLILQGLIDRTELLAPLPAAGVNLLSVRAQLDGHVILVSDGDDALLLTDGRVSFRDWQRQVNAGLRPGLRVVGQFNYHTLEDRVRPESCRSLPGTGVPHMIEGRENGMLKLLFNRTDTVWRRNVPVPDRPGYVYRHETEVTPSRRASALLDVDDDFILALDLASTADLRYYLASREDRSKHFLSMVPVLRAALSAREAQAQAEAPFRRLLAAQLVMLGADTGTVDDLVEDLVHWWRIARTWTQPLNGDGPFEAKAAAEIVAEYHRRCAADDDTLAEQMIHVGRRLPDCIAVVRDREGAWFALTPTRGVHDWGVYLDWTRIRQDGTFGVVQRELPLSARRRSGLHVGWSNAEWGRWKVAANPNHYLTSAQRSDVIARVEQEALTLTPGQVVAVTERFDEKSPETRLFQVYVWTPTTEKPATVIASSDPCAWRHRDTSPVAWHAFEVAKKGGSITVRRAGRYRDGVTSDFSAFTLKQAGMGLPWWPDDAHDYGEARPRLSRLDDSAMEKLSAYVDQCKQAAAADDDAREARRRDANTLADGVWDAIVSELVAKARARFDEDYGPGQDELWERHLRRHPVAAPRGLADLEVAIMRLLGQGVPVAGLTLTELAEQANGWHGHGHVSLQPGDYGQFRIGPHPAR